jgi:hemerythrin-like domain-containing protein
MEGNLIDKLISEHDSLKKILGRVKNEAIKDAPDFTAVFGGLKKFKKLLGAHMDLENYELYPELFKKYWDRPNDIEYINSFKSEMDELAREIENFLEEYTYKDKIERLLPEFRKNLDFIISSLQIRISSEEKGVFLL